MLATFRKLAFLSPTRSVHSFTKECLAWHLTSKPSNHCGSSLWDPRTLMSTTPFSDSSAFQHAWYPCVLAFIWRERAQKDFWRVIRRRRGLDACGRKRNFGFRAQTKLSMKIGRGSWSLASRKASALCLRLWDLKCSFVFFPLLTQTTTWQVSQHLRSSFFFLGVAVLPPLEVELMGFLCLEGRFLFWSSFTSAWKHSLCLLSDSLHSSDHCQLSPRLPRDICGPYAGLFRVEHSELAEQKIWFLVSLCQSPRPVWSPWRTVAENHAESIPGWDLWTSLARCLFKECPEGTVCSFALELDICGKAHLRPGLWMVERALAGLEPLHVTVLR